MEFSLPALHIISDLDKDLEGSASNLHMKKLVDYISNINIQKHKTSWNSYT